MTNKEAIIIKLLEFKQGDIDLTEMITAVEEYSSPLLNALGSLLGEDSECPMCDRGKLRNPKKEHWDDCGWGNAQKVYEEYKQ